MTDQGDRAGSEPPATGPEHQERPLPAPPPGPPPAAVGTLEPPPPGPPWRPAPSPWPGWIATGYVGVAGFLIVFVVVASESVTWFLDQLAIAEDTGRPNWPVVGAVTALVALGFAVPALFFRRWPALRAAGIAWAVSALLLGLLGVPRAVPYVHNELHLALFALVSGGIVIVWRLLRRPRRPVPQVAQPDGSVTADLVPEPVRTIWPADAVWLAAGGGLASLLPWLWWGALGGVLETVLAALAAGGFGALAGTVLGGGFWRPYARLARWKLVLGGGYVAGVALAVLTAGLGGAGVQLTALVALPALGYAAAALQRRFVTPSGAPVGVLVGVAAFGPLGFADPEEFSLLLGFESVWVLFAAVAALGVALGFALGVAVALRRAVARPWLAALVAVVVGLAGVGVYAAAGRPGFHGERLFVVLSSQASLSGVAGSRTERIGTVYRRLVAHAERTQRPLRRELDRLGLDYTPYYLVNGISVEAGPVVREWLSRRTDVDRVLLDPVLRPIPGAPSGLPVATEPGPRAPRWNLEMVGAPRVWSGYDTTGEGIVVGSSDSGVDGDHEALRDGFRGGDDSWYDPWHHTRTPTDPGGHGTHTLGSAVGTHDIGVAPGAEWIGCVNLARNMAGPSRYLECLQFMLAPFGRGEDPFRDGDPGRAPHVLNNSWGCPELEGCDTGALRPAVDAFRVAGIFFVASAGNTGPRCGSLTDPPARYPDSFTVGAVTEARRVADFSSRGRDGSGPRPDLVAPGAQVLSAVPGGRYARLDGTSMAGPHVAGAVALLWSAVPSLVGDIEATEKLLRDTARPVRGDDRCGATASSGAGIVDVYAAIRTANPSPRS